MEHDGTAHAPTAYRVGLSTLEWADAADCYGAWPTPTMIHIDGPYGISGFPGDPKSYRDLPEAYSRHIAAWTLAATPQTTLWFWGTEVGWATVHPLLDAAGWDYQELCVWNKGLSHVAGNVNSKTIRGVPVVTEVCVRYALRPRLKSTDGIELPLKEWVRSEWKRSGIPLCRANEACGVKNAATRKYLTADDKWYFPPADAAVAMSAYLTKHGRPTNIPYFSIDRVHPLTEEAWSALRPKWHHIHGVTNVWTVPQLMSRERIRVEGTGKALHLNQKPEQLLEYLVATSTDPGDVVWDPFAGTASMACVANRMGRTCYCAEVSREVAASAGRHLAESWRRDAGSSERMAAS